MGRVHARGPDEKIVISLNEKGQAIADDSKIISELSNFCGVLARDNISLTYINWHVVPDQLKKKLWEYALVNSINKNRLDHFPHLCIELINLIIEFYVYYV